MDSEIRWLSQRITLLRNHLQELKELAFKEKAQRQQLTHQHQQQVGNEDNLINKVRLVTEYTCQLTLLSVYFSQERKGVLARQKQEEIKQNKQIDSERRKRE